MADKIKNWDPTWRDSSAGWLQEQLKKLGMSNYQALQTSRQIMGGGQQAIGLADITPVGAVFGSQEGGLQAGRGAGMMAGGDIGGGLLNAGLGGLSLAAAPIGRILKPGKSAASKAAEEIAAAIESKSVPAGLADRIVQAPTTTQMADLYLTGVNAGNFRGTNAFGGIKPENLDQMRQNYMAKMGEGADARLWYDYSSADINRWTGGIPSQSDNMANMLATTSARTPVGTNLMYANKGWNQHLVGDPIKTGGFPNTMGQTIQDHMANPGATELGLKRSPFSAGLSVAWRGPEFANRPTHDIHDVRAWGINDPATGELWSKGVPNAGHRFLDDQADWVTREANANNLGGYNDWNAYRAQAAAWISQKAKTDGTAITEAQKHYGTWAPEFQGMLPREWTPGDNTGHLPELLNAPFHVRKAYADALEQHVIGPQGVDKLAVNSGALTDRTLPNLGIYEGSTNPGFMTMINVGKGSGGQEMDESSQKVLDAIASAHGLLGAQKQVANNYQGGPVAQLRSGSMRLPGDISDSELEQLARNMKADWGIDAVMRDPKGGARVLNWLEPDQRQELARQMTPPKWAPPGMYPAPEFRANSGNLIPFDAPAQWSSRPFIEAIDAAGPMAGRISQAMQPIAGDVLKHVNAMSAANGWTQAPWFGPMMEGLRDGGIPRLKELVKQGVVPVVALTAVGGMPGLLGQDDRSN